MTVRVLFFSVLRDLTGCDQTDWSCAPDATLGNLIQQLQDRWPALRDWDASLLFAIDCDYARRDAPLHHGCEVAIMPPVQGG
jgi:molybdopterin converting factor small subunit